MSESEMELPETADESRYSTVMEYPFLAVSGPSWKVNFIDETGTPPTITRESFYKLAKCRSMNKLAVLAATRNDGRLDNKEMNPTPGSPPAPVQGVNVMLGGAMLSGIILVVFILCYCCHKTNKKTHTNLPSYWRDPALSMEIYTVESQNYSSILCLSIPSKTREAAQASQLYVTARLLLAPLNVVDELQAPNLFGKKKEREGLIWYVS
ncbi:hypothetical protein NQ317_000805 [Molorchus minor]|uniref:Uncharacterized protein n=1 Tax=Molorchus minor TaxID=1323400 RepID=A0ABQ9J427_9CUCU|nr:hypothetical protein NQ317_000805 [Molorchus minor]